MEELKSPPPPSQPFWGRETDRASAQEGNSPLIQESEAPAKAVMKGSLYYELRLHPSHFKVLWLDAISDLGGFQVFMHLSPLSPPPSELQKERERPSYPHSVALGDGC